MRSKAPIDTDFDLTKFKRLSDLHDFKSDRSYNESVERALLPTNDGNKKAEIVVLVGPASSGKSRLARSMVSSSSFVRINQDTLKTLAACIARAKEELTEGRSVVVDSTNLSIEIRANWIRLGKAMGASVRCVFIQIEKELVLMLRALRQSDPSTLLEDKRRIEDVCNFYVNN